MEAKKLQKYRKQLLELRAQVMNRAQNVSSSIFSLNPEDLVDETDHAAAVVQQNVALDVQRRDRILLKEIERALAKFEEGTYGVCEDSEELIDEARLDAQPWTRYCVEAAELREHKAKRFAGGGY